MDVLRHELLHGSTGLPFGILTANTQFVDATYLISPEFRMNVFGLIQSKKMVFGSSSRGLHLTRPSRWSIFGAAHDTPEPQ
jgi:hypothetical protein